MHTRFGTELLSGLGLPRLKITGSSLDLPTLAGNLASRGVHPPLAWWISDRLLL